MLKLFIKNTDVTEYVQTVNWSGDYQQCSRTLKFELLSYNKDKNIPILPCDLGDSVTLIQDSNTLFNGYVFNRQKDTNNSIIDITCYDRGFYLKKIEATYKFENTTPESITRRVCSDYNIPIGNIANTNIKVSRNFVGTNLYNIIQTVYTLASNVNGQKYIVRFEGSNLSVVKKKVSDTTLVIESGVNLMSASVSESIEDMINQVVIYDENDKLINTQKDDNLIKLYGLMQSYLKDNKNENTIAKAKKMIEDNGVSQKITIENLGNIANITGNTVVVREPYTKLYGLFYIDSDVHTWKRGQYYNKLVVNFKNIMDEQEAGSLPNKDGSKTKSDSATWDYKNKPQ